jgi:excisionase family DNA binding protein
MPKAKPPKVMAAGDVADLLGVSYQYIDKLAKEGRLPFQQTSSGKIFLEKDILRFKKARDRKAKTDPRIKKNRS